MQQFEHDDGKRAAGASGLARAGWFWPLVYALCIVNAWVRGARCAPRPSGCIEPYWIDFWLLDYSQGYQRRALIGTLMRGLSPQHLDVVLLHATTLAVLVLLVWSLVRRVHRAGGSFWGRAALALLLFSPLTSVFFEALGDPLQPVFLLFAGLLALPLPDGALAARRVAAGIFCLVALLIHEAAVFLFVPAVLLWASRPQTVPRRLWLAAALTGALLLGAVLGLETLRAPVPAADYRAFNPLIGVELGRSPTPLPSFAALLREEYAHYFGSAVALAKFLAKIARVFFIPLLALLLLAVVMPAAAVRRLLHHWVFLSLYSLPLYGIAMDWGRFSSYTFWLALTLSLARPDGPPAPQALATAGARWTPALRRLRARPAEAVAAIGFLMLASGAISPEYRIAGMRAPSLALLPLVPLLLGGLLLRRDRAASAAAQQPAGPEPADGGEGSRPLPQ